MNLSYIKFERIFIKILNKQLSMITKKEVKFCRRKIET